MNRQSSHGIRIAVNKFWFLSNIQRFIYLKKGIHPYTEDIGECFHRECFSQVVKTIIEFFRQRFISRRNTSQSVCY